MEDIAAKYRQYVVSLSDFTIEKNIGNGGFGAVSLGIQKLTGRKCAIKELRDQSLDNRQLEFFIREVTILSESNCRFLVPFVGFTITPPYSIVTEFVPKGSLADALHGRDKKIDLSGTQKSLIAAGIALGLDSLHKLGVIHRDLKSANVLLDEKMLPKVCDFGVSRFCSEDQTTLTQHIGTPIFMAPELMQSGRYDFKVDVYAYAIVLWELLTGSYPYKSLNNYQIMDLVCHQKRRPEIPTGTPISIQKLIQSCWHPNPQQRPTFEMIADAFQRKVVQFEGTDGKQIDAFFAELNSYPTVQAAITVAKNDMESDPKSLSNTISELVGSRSPVSAMTPSIKQLAQLVRHSNFAECACKVIGILPYSYPDLLTSCLNILTGVALKSPEKIDPQIMLSVASFIDRETLKILRLYDIVLSKLFNEILSEKFLSLASYFAQSKFEYCYLQVLFHLMSMTEAFKQSKQDMCIGAIAEGLKSSDPKSVSAAFSLLTSIGITQSSIDPNLVISHLSDSSALCFLSSCLLTKLNKQLIVELLRLPKPQPAVPFAIIRQACSLAGATFVAEEASQWLGTKKFDIETTYRILLTVLSYKELNEKISVLPQISSFLSQLLDTGNRELIQTISQAIRVMTISPSFVINLAQSQFFEKYFAICSAVNDPNLDAECIILIDALCRKQFCSSFLAYFDRAVSFWNTTPSMRKYTLNYLTWMSSNEEGVQVIAQKGVLNTMSDVGLDENLKQLLDAARYNVNLFTNK